MIWVCQKYIENPLLVMNRKFDIRVWVFVSSWNPYKVYYFRSCYIRFSSQDYDPKKTDNLFSHLTNNSITSKQIKMGDGFEKIPGNMWHLSQLKKYMNNYCKKNAANYRKRNFVKKPDSASNHSSDLHKLNETASTMEESPQPFRMNPGRSKSSMDGNESGDIWDSILLPQLKDIIKLTFLSGWGYVEWREGSVGIYGLDIMIDQDLKMWLIEVNMSPCMAHSTDVTGKLVPKFFEDITKVIVDKSENTGDLE